MKTIAVDFDGVIHRYRFGYGKFDEPMEGAAESLAKILDQGWSIVIHSACPEGEIKKWCFLNNFWILMGKDGTWNKNVSYWAKPPAKFYIDDRAIRFISWKDIEKYVL